MTRSIANTVSELHAACCVIGGGPAGMMLGYLLARAGVDVVVLEKHGDFLRDFRGDTVHPSTLEVLYELGVLEEFLKRPHQEVRQLSGNVGGAEVVVADLTHLPTHCKFLALMPQWDFLNFLAEQARRYPAFHILMNAEVTGLIEKDGSVLGVRAQTADGPLNVYAKLVVGADGRHSTVRECGSLKVDQFSVPIDVLWMRLSRHPSDRRQPLGFFERGRVFVMLDRDDYWQCAFVIPKGMLDEIHARGLDAFRRDIAEIAPFLEDRVAELRDWNDVKLLTVLIDRLQKWYRPGLLCIGDAAHAMSPIGGVGINLAIQDAVAAANILAAPLRDNHLSIADLQKVQRRRAFPTRAMQRLQVFIQNRVIRRVLANPRPQRVPWLVKLLRAWPLLRRIPARIFGLGFRHEHVRTPDMLQQDVSHARSERVLV